MAALAAGLSHQAAAAAVLPRAAADPPPPLRFRDNGTFHLSVFSDLHFGEGTLSSPPITHLHSFARWCLPPSCRASVCVGDGAGLLAFLIVSG